MAKVKVSSKEVASIIAELEQSLHADLSALAKSDDESPAPEETEGSAPPAPEASASPGPEASAPPASPPASPSAPPMEGSPAPEASAPPPGPGGEAGGLEAQFQQMDLQQLKSVYLAAKAALVSKMGAQSPEAGGPPPAPTPEASAPPAPPAEPPMAMKSEKSPEVELLKAELEAMKASMAKQNEVAEMLAQAVLTLKDTPVRKAITDISDIRRKPTEETAAPVSNLSKSEVMSRLTKKARTNLSKSDRDLINGYCTGKEPLEKLNHLLKD